jgi:hypothetical protein
MGNAGVHRRCAFYLSTYNMRGFPKLEKALDGFVIAGLP